jgi:hypothetical protein
VHAAGFRGVSNDSAKPLYRWIPAHGFRPFPRNRYRTFDGAARQNSMEAPGLGGLESLRVMGGRVATVRSEY